MSTLFSLWTDFATGTSTILNSFTPNSYQLYIKKESGQTLTFWFITRCSENWGTPDNSKPFIFPCMLDSWHSWCITVSVVSFRILRYGQWISFKIQTSNPIWPNVAVGLLKVSDMNMHIPECDLSNALHMWFNLII